MSEREVHEMQKLLRAAVRSVAREELERDLWPSMLDRLSPGAAAVPWWDWALLAGTSLVLWFRPEMVAALLYHL